MAFRRSGRSDRQARYGIVARETLVVSRQLSAFSRQQSRFHCTRRGRGSIQVLRGPVDERNTHFPLGCLKSRVCYAWYGSMPPIATECGETTHVSQTKP